MVFELRYENGLRKMIVGALMIISTKITLKSSTQNPNTELTDTLGRPDGLEDQDDVPKWFQHVMEQHHIRK